MGFKNKARPVEILLIEDNPGDVRLTKEALKEGKLINNLHVVEDGVEALAYLKKQRKLFVCLIQRKIITAKNMKCN